MSKVLKAAHASVADIRRGAPLAVGSVGLCGIAVELLPRETLAERLRAGGTGLAAFARDGNLRCDKSAQSFNPLCAMAGTVGTADVEDLVEPGDLDAAAAHAREFSFIG